MEYVAANQIYRIDLTPFAPNDSDKFHLLVSRNPALDFKVEDLRSIICNLMEISKACTTLKIKEIALNG